MARKQTGGGEGTRGKERARREKPPSATASGRMLLLLENIESQNRATIEAVSATRNELRQEMASFRAQVEGRFSTLEAAIRHNSGEIRELKAVAADHTVRLQNIAAKLDQKADASRVAALEERVEALLAAS